MNCTPNYLCDMHCHSKRSDGNDEPWELVEKAISLGMKIIAITDHDIVPPQNIIKNGFEIDILEFAHRSGIDLIKGMEVSCDTEVEDVHILAFGCIWSSAYFSKLHELTKNSKVESYTKLIQALIKNKIDIGWDEILENQGNYLEPEKVQKKYIFEMIAKKGYTKSWQEAKIMVKETPAFNIKREKPNPLDIIDEIHKAGGIAVLAHPYLIDENIHMSGKTINRDQYIERLIAIGLDGIEACYTYDKTSYKGTKSKEEICSEVLYKYKDRVSILSGGSDYHSDDKKGVRNARNMGECGISPEYFYNNKLLSKLSGINIIK